MTTTQSRPRPTTERADHYWEHGHLTLRGLLDAERAAELGAEARRLLDRNEGFIDIPEAAVRVDRNGRPVRDRLDPAAPFSPFIRELSRDAKITAAVGEVFGDDAFLLRDKIIFKPPGLRGYGLHHDFAYWEWMGLPPDDVLSVMVCIDRADRPTGPLIVYSGYHRKRLGPPPPPGDRRDIDPALVDESRAVWCIGEPGDAVAFHSLTPHRSEPNSSDRYRRVLYLTYNAARHGDLYQDYQRKRFH